MMKVKLIDVDSKIPNLALMKISAWHKSKGDQVGFDVENPDLVYISCIYRRNRGWIPLDVFNGSEVVYGGTGYDLNSKLSDKIEFIKPDYDLYPSEYSQGFTTRGCVRNCHFCVVPKKEGGLQQWQHPSEFHDDRFDTIMLLDNNWLADKKWFMETSSWILNHGLTVWEHGLDIRLMDEEIADRLSKLKMKKGYHFSFDYTSLEHVIKEKCKMLEEYGINLRSEVQFYVYVDSDEQFEDALYRCSVLKEIGTNPFVMYNIDKPRTERIKALQRWANRKWLFWKVNFKDYQRNRRKKEKAKKEKWSRISI